MAIECVACGHQGDVVHFRRPEGRPRPVRILWLLLAFGGITSVVQIGSLLGQAWPLFQAAVVVESTVGSESGEPVVRDYLRIFTNTAGLFLIGICVAMLFVAGRYFQLLLRGLRSGHPSTWARIRAIARVQLLLEAFAFLGVGVIYSRLEVIQRSPGIGVGVLLAPVILFLLRRPDVRAYFSVHRIEPAPERPPPAEPQPSVATEPGPSA